jgi:hypothetical protein
LTESADERLSEEPTRRVVLYDETGSSSDDGQPPHSPGQAWYVGQRVRERLIRWLVEQRVEQGVARFALEGWGGPLSRTGAARNLLMLLTAGESVVSLDDGIGADPLLALDDYPETLTLHSSSDPRRCRCDRSAGDLARGTAPASRGLVRAMSVMLGRTVGDLMVDKVDLQTALDLDPPVLDRIIRHGGALRVVAVIPGVLGPPETSRSAWPTVASGPGWRRLAPAEETHCAARVSGPCLHSVDSPVASLSTFFAGRCFGYDNGSPGVPFSPSFEDCDFLFGAMLQASASDACIGYIPEIVRHHVPDGQPARRRFECRSVRPGMCQLLASLVRTLQPTWQSDDPEGWCSYLGAALEATSAVDDDAFLEVAYECAHSAWIKDYRRIEELLDSGAALARSVRRDLNEVRRQLKRALQRPQAALPDDVPEPAGGGAGIEQVRRYVRDFAHLVTAWPTMWKACAALTVSERETLLFGAH